MENKLSLIVLEAMIKFSTWSYRIGPALAVGEHNTNRLSDDYIVYCFCWAVDLWFYVLNKLMLRPVMNPYLVLRYIFIEFYAHVFKILSCYPLPHSFHRLSFPYPSFNIQLHVHVHDLFEYINIFQLLLKVVQSTDCSTVHVSS